MNATNLENAIQSNGTEEDFDDTPIDYETYSIPLGVVAVIIVVVNSFIVILVTTNVKLRTNCNALLASLAITDGTTGLIGIPLLLVFWLHETLEKFCYLHLAIYSWFWFMSVCSNLHLLVIACEQYFAILKPFNHDKIVTKKSVTLAITAIWTISLANAFIPWTWYIPMGEFFCVIEDATADRNYRIFIIVSIILLYLLPVGMIIYVYICIVIEAKCQKRRIHRERSVCQAEYLFKPSCANFRGFYVIAFMWFLYIVCWTPYFVVVVVVEMRQEYLPFWLDYKLLMLRLLPPLLHPLLFAFWKRDFRAACLNLFNHRSASSTALPAASTKQTLLNRMSDSLKNQSL